MSKQNLKRLSTIEDSLVHIENPIDEDEIKNRHSDYVLLPPQQFAKKYRSLLYKPMEVTYKSQKFEINYNHCVDPFCKWFGLPQKKYEDIKGKPSRYFLDGPNGSTQRIQCNDDPVRRGVGSLTFQCKTQTVSNWSVAEEILRLETINQIQGFNNSDYEFHKESCSISIASPFHHPREFYRRGKSSSNSQKWQCKECKKITNVLPIRNQSFTYHQKRNDVLHSIALAIVNRVPVKRTCEMLKIGSSTYYNKLELLYQRCLEFNERFETEAFASKSFDTMWMNSDKLQYNLNNVRKKGHGGQRYDNVEDRLMQTYIVVTSEIQSRYIMRSDVAYDWNITLEQIEQDTVHYKDDHLDSFSRKNERYRFPFAPQPPTPSDTQSKEQYIDVRSDFDKRKAYIDGLHIDSSYTTMAHLWHIKRMVNAKEWRMITDDDPSLYNSFFRVFSKEIRLAEAHHFIAHINKSKSRQTAYMEYQEGRRDLTAWGINNGIDGSISRIAYLKLKKQLENHKFHDEVIENGKTYRKWGSNKIVHPFPTIDQGWYQVSATTDLSSYEPKDIAKMVLKVNDKSNNAFMQQIRRRINILERPLVTARGDGKSYIYANFNPQYAQYALTILQTFYNFCYPFKMGSDEKLTPAQRLGLTDKVFSIQDIIYFK